MTVNVKILLWVNRESVEVNRYSTEKTYIKRLLIRCKELPFNFLVGCDSQNGGHDNCNNLSEIHDIKFWSRRPYYELDESYKKIKKIPIRKLFSIITRYFIIISSFRICSASKILNEEPPWSEMTNTLTVTYTFVWVFVLRLRHKSECKIYRLRRDFQKIVRLAAKRSWQIVKMLVTVQISISGGILDPGLSP